MKNPFRRRKPEESPKEESSERAKLGGICFVLGEDGEKHAVSPEDMPANVRAYFEELGNQMRDEGGDGILKMESDNLPDYVSEYMAEQVLGALADDMENEPEKVKLRDMPRSISESAMEETIKKLVRRYSEEVPDCRENISPCAGILNMIFAILLRHDEDWQQLTVSEAGRLYAGVCMAMMEATIAAVRISREHGGGDDEEDA